MTKLVVLIGFSVAFAAGLTVGMKHEQQRDMSGSVASTMPTSRPSHRGFLPSELNLTPQQQEQLSKIWSDVARGGRGEQDKQRQQLREKRDAEIAALIQPADKEKYDKALSDYRDAIKEMDEAARDRFKKAVDETMALLTPEQRAKYQEILSRHPFAGPGGPGGPFGRGRGDRETTRRGEPATRPVPAQ